ncbi:CRISPR-associated helicase Cas3' [Aromatoleum anaerobium]|uniref:CRISPR-associated helicase Cas3 n=1 Tax=Aromatoleum anaerobium TaxID=182180 RepID=A0ABX1PP78_9RHOO|nr:CRISPR-associated helicase Cas3' [Aromatoleum anaerobium]MCK0506038.1 CRISPR-associated helicase Cas3' [Aromatoleum anaerobium]
MIQFSRLSAACRYVWAKSGEGHGHGVLAHMLDVAAVATAILEREAPSTRSWIARNFALPFDSAVRWLATIVGLHDFGKGITGFQAKWPEGRQVDESAGLPFAPRNLEPHDHAAATWALLRALLSEKIEHRGWISGVLQGISAHHGFNYLRPEIERARPAYEATAWTDTRQELFDAYWQTMAPIGQPTCEALSLTAVEWLAGLTSVADWIGSNAEWFPLGERADDLTKHFDAARQLAERALDRIGWPHFRPLLAGVEDIDRLIRRIIGTDDEVRARPLQATADTLLASADGPTLLIVEAPMGEGKTELAMLAHLRLQAANHHRGLYVALPTQATGNAMFDRTLSFLRAFTDGMPLDIQLAHGGAVLDERVAHLRGIHGEPGDNVSSSAWFSQRRRALISPYGVGTIDQALFATLNVKHHFVRLWGLANRVVVLDEVHAYDTYTSGLIAALLRWLKALNCSVVLMSATLPRKRQTELLAAWGIAKSDVPTLAYPRLLAAHQGGIIGDTVAARPLPPINVHGIAEAPEALAAHAMAQLASGGCGAIVVNTVDRAQQLYRLLHDQLSADCTLMLFHARYPADERSQRERAVLGSFGRNGKRPARALLIATQVAEQSLDIDFDFMISDLAPIDLLLQRAGRLHRHERTRPDAHSEAQLAVAGLIAGRFPELKETAWQYVYDAYILGRTWALTASETVWQLPHDIDRLVQRVYDDDVELPDDLSAEDRKRIDESTYGEHRAKEQQEFLYAMHAAIDADAEPQHAYADKPRGNEEGEGLGIRNRTRLGDDGITVVPVWVSDTGWRVHPDEPPFNPEEPASDALAHRLFARQLKLSHKAVVAELGAVEPPRCFTEHPLLRNLKPLRFADGHATAGDLTLRLDPELGLVYDKG